MAPDARVAHTLPPPPPPASPLPPLPGPQYPGVRHVHVHGSPSCNATAGSDPTGRLQNGRFDAGVESACGFIALLAKTIARAVAQLKLAYTCSFEISDSGDARPRDPATGLRDGGMMLISALNKVLLSHFQKP